MSPIRQSVSTILFVALCLQACNDDDTTASAPEAGSTVSAAKPDAPAPSDDGCVRHTLEADMQSMPFAGPGVRHGALVPGQYLMATTYLRLRGDRSELFNELVGPVVADITTRDGLIALRTASSEACGVARTLTVWRDEAAMLEFVVGKPHARAMQSIYDLSRGGSVAAQWTGDQSAASWEAAAEHLATTDHAEY